MRNWTFEDERYTRGGSLGQHPQDLGRDIELSAIREYARDLQVAFDDGRTRIVPVSVEVPFGKEQNGAMLSDHMGYTIHYRLQNDRRWALNSPS